MIKILFIGCPSPDNFNCVWGGSAMTTYCYLKAFENDPEFQIRFMNRANFTPDNLENVRECDLLHIDDLGTLEKIIKLGWSPPDIIGPISRSPVKQYSDGRQPLYSADWFYGTTVIRLNDAEERNTEYIDKIHYITHGVDTDLLQPVTREKRRYVLWAGNQNRDAKNYPLWLDIQDGFQLPSGFEFKTLSGYNLQDYWNILEDTAILVNTSKYESFCNALFEARSRGIATIQREGLNGNRWLNAYYQVGYTKSAYQEAIEYILKENNYINLGEINRDYVMINTTLKKMRDSYAEIFRKAVVKK